MAGMRRSIRSRRRIKAVLCRQGELTATSRRQRSAVIHERWPAPSAGTTRSTIGSLALGKHATARLAGIFLNRGSQQETIADVKGESFSPEPTAGVPSAVAVGSGLNDRVPTLNSVTASRIQEVVTP